MDRNQMYRSISDIPERKPVNQTGKLPPFWEVMESEITRSSINLLILNEIRHSNPEMDTNESCRSRLAKLRGYIDLLDLASSIENQQKEEPVEQTEI